MKLFRPNNNRTLFFNRFPPFLFPFRRRPDPSRGPEPAHRAAPLQLPPQVADGLARLRDAQAQDRLLAGGGDHGGCKLSREVRATHGGSCFFRIQFRISISFFIFLRRRKQKRPLTVRDNSTEVQVLGEREREGMERKIEVFQGLLSTRKRWKIAHSYILHLPSPFSCYIGLTTPYFPLSPSFFLEILLSDRHQTTPPSLLHHYHSFPLNCKYSFPCAPNSGGGFPPPLYSFLSYEPRHTD